MKDWLSELKELDSKGTPAPWIDDTSTGFIGGPVGHGTLAQTWSKSEEDFGNPDANRALIVHLRNHTADILQLAERLNNAESLLKLARPYLDNDTSVADYVDEYFNPKECSRGV